MHARSRRRSVARPAAVVALAALVALAGCLGGGTTGPTTSTSPTPTATEAETDGTASAASATPTPTPEATATAAPAGEPGVGFVDDHVAAIRERGSVTVRSNLTVERGETRLNQSLLARLDLESGRALTVRNPLGGPRRATYLAANGSAYSQQTLMTGKTTVYGPHATPAPNVSTILGHRALRLVANLSLEDRGETTYRGVSGHLYRATNASAIDESALGDEDDGPTIRRFDYALVVGDAGYAKYARYNITYRTDDGNLTMVDSVRYEAVGETTVSEPGWLGAAVEKARRPGPGDLVTRTYTVETASGRVDQAITAPKSDQRDGPGVGPTVSGNPSFYNPTLNGTSVGSVVRLYWPESTTRVNATFRYREGDVPLGNESGLTVAVFDREIGTFVSMTEHGATVVRHPDSDAISLVVEDPETLERYQGQTFLVMNVELFRDRAFGDG